MKTKKNNIILGIFKRIFGGGEEKIYALKDVEFTAADYESISNFLKSASGEKFIEHLRVRQVAIADRAANQDRNAENWMGFVRGYKAAIDGMILTFREPPVNGEISSDSSGVGLEELAEILRPKEE